MAYPIKSDAEWKQINYDKEKSIAYFSSLKAAIEVLKTEAEESTHRIADSGKKAYLLHWRDFFFKEWEQWYEKECKENVVKAGTTPLPPPISSTEARDRAEEESKEESKQRSVEGKQL